MGESHLVQYYNANEQVLLVALGYYNLILLSLIQHLLSVENGSVVIVQALAYTVLN